jgi:hypothetical protein
MTSLPSGNRSPENWDDDDLLLRDLKGALRAVPPAPAEFLDAARAALTWRTIDSELAELTYDSAADLALSSRTRSGSGPRTLAFSSRDVTVELELSDAVIVGQVSRGGGGEVSIETSAGVVASTTLDEIGCFVLTHRPDGLFRLSVRGGEYAVVTGWLRLR